MIKLQRVMLCLVVLATLDARAGAGLTSAGVTSQQPTAQEEPTLAQVAPTTGTQGGGSTPVSIAGNPVPGTGVAVPGAAAANAPGTAAAAQAAPAPRVVTPPPPPDPATLPTSVIRPLNKAGSDAAAPAGGGAPPAAEPAAVADSAPASRTPHALSPGPKSPQQPTGSTSLPVPTARVAASSPARTEAPAKTVPETPPEEPADASSSGVIFYTGSGIAAVVLLLAFTAFMRGSKEDGA